jgi:transcriptional regulator with XRE-family HTH domain
MSIIGDNLRRIRKEKNISQMDLYRITKVSNVYINKIEKGVYDNPSFDVIERLAFGLNCTIDDLTRNTEEDNEKNIYEMIEEILKKNNMHNEETQVAALLLAKLRSNNLINEDFEMTPSLVKLLEEAIRLDAKIEKNIKNAEDE